ncbi:dipeptidase [Risungbinella massiliensis]|uniref:dipeptidase n=1 Tax=Risungbinella massiliensis TaxID=1329796 RepID=UPI0005CBB64C|nr:dipeptidase [Risungbinella massiliensis]
MRIIDAHCDVLSKLWRDPSKDLFYQANSTLDASYEQLQKANILSQVFAVFISPRVPPTERFRAALEQIDLFYEQVLGDQSKMQLVTNQGDFLGIGERQIGAVLALEGLDSIQGELMKLRVFYRLGVRFVGLTWNYANEVADGILEGRNGGLTEFGRQVMQEINRLHMMVDVSHVCEQGFWDVMQYSNIPVLASHSNARAICPHPRNLTDEQIHALIERDGRIGITFYPPFLTQSEARLEHVLRQIEYICELGGENNIVFGSDFDGIETKVVGLEKAGCYPTLLDYLANYYSTEQIYKFSCQNMARFYQKNLDIS